LAKNEIAGLNQTIVLLTKRYSPQNQKTKNIL